MFSRMNSFSLRSSEMFEKLVDSTPSIFNEWENRSTSSGV